MPDIYLLIDGQQSGPYTKEQLAQSLSDGLIPSNLPGWHEGLDEWIEIERLLQSHDGPVLSELANDEGLVVTTQKSAPGSGPTHQADPVPSPEKQAKSTFSFLLASILTYGLLATIAVGVAIFIWHVNNPKPQVIPFSRIDRQLLASLEKPQQIDQISFTQLWADAATYLNVPFIFHGEVNIPVSNDSLFGDASVYSSSDYRQINIKSLDKPPDGVDTDLVTGYVEKDIGRKLVDLASSDGSKHYEGYFLLYIPRVFADQNQYKQSGGSAIGEPWRTVRCEIIAYAPDLKSLQNEIRPEDEPFDSTSAASAVVSQNFTNSLGVKFVPAGSNGILFSVWDVRVRDYRAFVQASGRYWRNAEFAQTDDDPAVGVSWDDANAFCDWLTEREQKSGKIKGGQRYRLPTDAEWSRAAGLDESEGGTPADKNGIPKDVYPWGSQWPPPKGAGNYDESLTHDGYVNTSPVGSFAANRYGLYDMGGNVWQWCEDRYDRNKDMRVLRGGYFGGWDADSTLLSGRNSSIPSQDVGCYGFRVVLEMQP